MLTHAQDLVTAEHRDFYVVEIPTRVTRTQFLSTVEMLPPETRARMKLISPLTAFTRAARPDLKLYYEEGHGHLSPTGARMLADEGLKAIKAHRNLPAVRLRALPQQGVRPNGMGLARHKQAAPGNSAATDIAGGVTSTRIPKGCSGGTHQDVASRSQGVYRRMWWHARESCVRRVCARL